MKFVVVFIYIGLMPFIETPYWCLERNENLKEDQYKFFYDCHVDLEYYVVKHSEIIDLNPLVTSTIDILCLAFFAYFRWLKSTWSV